MADSENSHPQWLGINEYQPRQPFIDFHNRDQRWAIMVCHRRAGKTVACVADLVLSALCTTKQDARFAYVAPQFNQAKDIAWLYLQRLTSDIPGVSYNIAELRANLPTGAQVRLYGADNPDRLRGLYLDGVILDEHADMRPRVWGEIVRPMLADRNGWAAFIGTPKGHNEFYQLWRSADQDPSWHTLMLRGSDSGLIAHSELVEMRKTMTDDQYDQEVECSFEAAILGAILGQYVERAEREGRINPQANYDPDGAPIEISSDIGFRDTAAWWFWQPTVGGFTLIDFDQDNGLDADDWIARLAQNPYKLAKIWLPHDAKAKTFQSKHTSIERFLKAFGTDKVGIVPIATKQDRINAARLVIERCAFHVEHCSDGLEALRAWQFEYIEELKVFSKEPKHDWASHASDAFSYGAQIMQQRVIEMREQQPIRGITVGQKTVSLDEMWAENRPKRKRI